MSEIEVFFGAVKLFLIDIVSPRFWPWYPVWAFAAWAGKTIGNAAGDAANREDARRAEWRNRKYK